MGDGPLEVTARLVSVLAGWIAVPLALACRTGRGTLIDGQGEHPKERPVIPETRYARSDGGYIAYQTIGNGPRDVMVTLSGPSHIEFLWELPEVAAFFERLAALGRLILYDKRGTGMSEATFEPTSLDQRADDVVAVMNAAGSDQAVQIGWLDGGVIGLATAAHHPSRVSSVVAGEVLAAIDTTTGAPAEADEGLSAMITAIESGAWGQGIGLLALAPDLQEDPRLVSFWRRLERMSGTPRAALQMFQDMRRLDMRPLLQRITSPVLLLHDEAHPTIDVGGVRWLADHLHDARLRLVRGSAVTAFILGDQAFEEIEEFLTGSRSSSLADHHVRTLLVTDLVASTEQLSRMGDSAWQSLLASHRAAVRRAVVRHDGWEVDTAGDGFLVAFDLPSSALRCAAEVVEASAASGVAVRAGVHAGEVLVRETGVVGVAVHATARIAAQAGAGEVLVSDTVRVLLAGAGVGFEPAGTHVLRGLPDAWALHRLVTGVGP